METTLPLYEPDVLNVNCRSRLAFDVVSDKWTPLVVYALRRGGRRYNQLRRDVGGVSAKMLSQSLRRLEADGLVERRVTPAVPPEVEYRLTPLGSTLLTPISVLVAWAEDHYLDVERHRAAGGATRP
ncbi:HxlR family transcriptional regulator (plasmid) [Deinococcus aetherius]|uniref:HxlR family transcriptional regulator n=1 Tax=Deinococcus aetherius TaxID=200252 RepID=A0ABN6RKI3_9DEIO|nr:helix-turn-helix domain-containing protein [Deinococcus aetherius]BDP43813.1 HxlR family transcriptional regulator [Deinococcus aetherius]